MGPKEHPATISSLNKSLGLPIATSHIQQRIRGGKGEIIVQTLFSALEWDIVSTAVEYSPAFQIAQRGLSRGAVMREWQRPDFLLSNGTDSWHLQVKATHNPSTKWGINPYQLGRYQKENSDLVLVVVALKERAIHAARVTDVQFGDLETSIHGNRLFYVDLTESAVPLDDFFPLDKARYAEVMDLIWREMSVELRPTFAISKLRRSS